MRGSCYSCLRGINPSPDCAASTQHRAGASGCVIRRAFHRSAATKVPIFAPRLKSPRIVLHSWQLLMSQLPTFPRGIPLPRRTDSEIRRRQRPPPIHDLSLSNTSPDHLNQRRSISPVIFSLDHILHQTTMDELRRIPGRPAPYGQACLSCFKSKCKCIVRADGDKCDR